MFPSNDPTETVPESASRELRTNSRVASSTLGFLVLWSAEEPLLLGAWLPVAAGSPEKPLVLGRGSSHGADRLERVMPFRQRPDGNHSLPALSSPSLSKTQLLLHVTAGSIVAQNVGRRRLIVNGQPMDRVELRPGDIVDLGSQLSLLCALRSQYWQPAPSALQPFGEPDAHGLVGESEAVWRLRAALNFAAARPGHVLVLGPSGTGKELVARALHAESKRRGPLVARNAATLPESLVDAELFGNAKGYPNPGMAERKGMIGAADGGTLFLDEFADLPAGAQAHVLRVLDAGEYHRLGDDKARHSDFRLVAATNRPASALRSDVLARFEFRIATPALAERPEDIPLIALHLLRGMTASDPGFQARFFSAQGVPRLSEGFVRRLVQHSYGANVRELRQLLWRALAGSPGDALTWPAAPEPAVDARASGASAEDSSREQLEQALHANNGSLEKTWRALGLAVTKNHGKA